MGLKLMQGLKIQVADIYINCTIPLFYYKGLKSNNSDNDRDNILPVEILACHKQQT